MSYTPTNWNTGDTITASALNKIENGIANAGGGGYDAEVHIYHDMYSAHDYECTIVSGSFASLASLLADNIVPTVLFKVWNDLGGYRVVALGYIYNFDITSSNQYITFHALQPYGTSGATGLMYINWTPNDEITV